MIIRSQNIECDVFTQTAKPVHFVQGEKGREIMFTFVNSAIPIEDEPQPILLSGLTATIHILKPDGNFIIDNMTINGNAALYVLTENACAAGGAGVYDVSLSRGTDVVYTAHGAYVGDFRAISDDVVNSISEAYGVVFPEGFQEKLVAGEHITIEDNVISAEGESYTAGDNIHISDENVISATDTRYTAGDNIQISQQNVISATDTQYTAGDNINISPQNVISASTGTAYSTTEHKVGTWITGEDVYEVIVGDESTPITDYLNLSAFNIKTIIDINAIACDSNTGISNAANMTMESMLSYAASNLLSYDKASKLLRVINFTGYYMYCLRIRYTKNA